MKSRFNLFVVFSLLCSSAINQFANAQDVYQTNRSSWLKKAEENKPPLIKKINEPQSLVTLVKDANAFQGWKAVPSGDMHSLYDSSFKKKSGVIVDFGQHLTGNFTFSLKQSGPAVSDGPLRFRLTFAEVPSELATPFDPYPGTISRGWLQDEVVTVMELPATITIPRRMAFRYLKIDLLGSSPFFDFTIPHMEFTSTTSAAAVPAPLSANTESIIADIDKVSLLTLKECMQTVYEDGPKRDRRLWIGDLYLESLANTYSFKNYNLTKRCLYLLAGLSREEGYLYSNVFETPQPHPQAGGAPFLFDYALLYDVALKEYFTATNDRETALDLWPLAKKQMEAPLKFLKPNGMFDNVAAAKARWWLFIDWKNELDREAAIQGVIIYSMKQTYELAKLLGKEKEVEQLPALIKKMTNAARANLFNAKTGLFESGPDRQISYASQAWMILSGVASKAEGQKAMRSLSSINNALHPGAPYMYHYVIDAMLQCGLNKEAKDALINYWGGMIKKGADTFWEVYDPGNDYLSPYNFFPVNSYCHAWSCTPSYFIRKYPSVFQNTGK